MLRLSLGIRAGVAQSLGRSPRWLRARLPWRRVAVGETPTPLRRTTRSRPLEPCEWAVALEAFCGGFRKVQGACGKAAASWAANPNLTNEELAFSTALACHGLGLTPGEPGAPPLLSGAWEAPEESDLVVAFGSAVTAADSPLWQRLSCNRHQPRVLAIAGGAAECPAREFARHVPRPG